jgi:integrase/recombinase XerD
VEIDSMASVYKPKAERDKGRRGRYRIAYVDASGRRRYRWGTSDKASSRRIAEKLETDVRLEKAGLAPGPAPANPEQGPTRTLGDLVDDYLAVLEARGRSKSYRRRVGRAIRKALEACGCNGVGDITPARLARHLTALESQGLSPRTINDHRAAVAAWARWLVSEGLLERDPFLGLPRRNEAVGRRNARVALDEIEVGFLLAGARVAGDRVALSKRRRDKAGQIRVGRTSIRVPHREWLYRLALATGLRAGELSSLTPDSFSIVGQEGLVTVEAEKSKRRRRDVLPLPSTMCDELGVWLVDLPRGVRIWPNLHRAAEIVRADLRAGGGEVLGEERIQAIDFHCLRHTFVSRLAAGGLPPKVVQTLSRHSTVTLTMDRYAHVDQQALRSAVDSVDLLVGTDAGTSSVLEFSDTDVTEQRIRQRAEITRVHEGALVCAGLDELPEGFVALKDLLIKELCAATHEDAPSGANSPARIRTWDQAIMSRLL